MDRCTPSDLRPVENGRMHGSIETEVSMQTDSTSFAGLYGRDCDENACRSRFQELMERFVEAFGVRGDAAFFSSPGRAEILGNHTDHNHGKVLVAAISCDTLSVAARDDRVRILSEGYPEVSFAPEDLTLREEERGTSAALVKGVMKGLVDRGYRVGGFVAAVTSGVFKGAGVSSSASYEVLIAEIMNALYNGGRISPENKAFVSQYAENEYFGKPCGLLDQMGIALGGISTIDFEDPDNPRKKTLFPDLQGYDIYIVNTGGDHSHLTFDYAGIKDDMHQVAEFFGKRVLREVDEELFYSQMPVLSRKLSGRAVLRAIHFFEENRRVTAAVAAVERGDIAAFLANVAASGKSSYQLLQNCYSPGDTVQRIPLALAMTEKLVSDGAARVHGGGFAGTILAFVGKAESRNYCDTMARIFGEANVFRLSVRESGATVLPRQEA